MKVKEGIAKQWFTSAHVLCFVALYNNLRVPRNRKVWVPLGLAIQA